MICQKDVAFFDIIGTVYRQAITHREPNQIGQKQRQAVCRESDAAAFGVDHADRVVFVLIHKWAERRTHQVGFDQIRN